MRVGLVDDSDLFRAGLRELLKAVGIQVAFEADDSDEMLARAAAHRPDAVVLDIRMPPTYTDEGLAAAVLLKRRYPEIGVLVLSPYRETGYPVQLLETGARGLGYLLQDRVDDVPALVDALERVRSGRWALDGDIVAGLIARRVDEFAALTARERAVLQHVAEGRSDAAIGRTMHLAVRTVETHVASAFAKLRWPARADDDRRAPAVVTRMRAPGDPRGG